MQCQAVMALGGVEIKFFPEVTCLGVMFDQELSCAIHMKQLVRKCFYHLCVLFFEQ